MAFKGLKKAFARYNALPPKKKYGYLAAFLIIHAIGLLVAIESKKLSQNLEPLAQKMEKLPAAWIILSLLIIIVSIPPLFGHEILALIAGYVYGATVGFIILTVSSIIGESLVYFGFRYYFRGALDRFRDKHSKNYGVFVAVVEDGGILMLWFIRMSIIPPHFSTPLFSSLRTITWWKWMVANIAASPVKFFPPVFIGTLLRSKSNNSVIGDVMFAISTLVTVGVLFHIRRAYRAKKRDEKARLAAEALAVEIGTTDKMDGDIKEFHVTEMEIGEGSFGGRGAGLEMSPMDKDGKRLSGWPEVPTEPRRVHLEETPRSPRQWV